MHHSLRRITALGFLGWATMFGGHGCSSRLGPVQATQSAGGLGSPNLPDIFVEQTKECVAIDAQQMTPGRIVLRSTITVNEDGDKLASNIDGIPQHASDFAACMRNALDKLPIAEQPFEEAVQTLRFHRKHAMDSDDAFIQYLEMLPGSPIVDSTLLLEADGYAVEVIVTVKLVPTMEKIIDGNEEMLTKLGTLAMQAIGYDEIMLRAKQMGWIKTVPVKQAQSNADKRLVADVVPSAAALAAGAAAGTQVITRAGAAALVTSQLDSPAPGPADAAAVGLFFVGLILAGGVTVYAIVTYEPPPVPTSVQAPQPQPPPVPPPPVPPPPVPPPPPRETCEANSELKKIIRCDDPKISHYDPWGEDAAFRNVVKDQGQGLKKSNRDDAIKGPCKDRGGFHINVLRRGDSVASIYGCNCCDDSNGKAIRKQRTETRKKY